VARPRGFPRQSISDLIQISYKTHLLLIGRHLLAPPLLVYLASEEARLATFAEWRYVKGIYEKGTTRISWRFKRAQYASAPGHLTFVRASTIRVSAAFLRVLDLTVRDIHVAGHSAISKTLPTCHSSRRIAPRKIHRVPEEYSTSTAETVKWITDDSKS